MESLPDTTHREVKTMPIPSDIPGLDDIADALANAIAARLTGRGLPGPADEPALPPGLHPGPWRDDPTGPLGAGATLGMGAVEFTQSIQHGGGGAEGSGPTVPLVAYKTMVVRTSPFVRRGMLASDTLTGQFVTGELTL